MYICLGNPANNGNDQKYVFAYCIQSSHYCDAASRGYSPAACTANPANCRSPGKLSKLTYVFTAFAHIVLH